MPITYSKEIKKGNWESGKVKKLEAFSIEIKPEGLLGSDHAEVTFFYETDNEEQNAGRNKRLVIFGKQDAVYSKSLLTIDRKKNEKEKFEMTKQFEDCWKLAKIQGRSYGWLGKKPQQGKPKFLDKKNVEVDHITFYKPDAFSEPSTLLSTKINNLGIDVKTFANSIGRQASVYSHTSGTRDISRDTAIEYAKKLNCDPVDLLFPKKTVPIWARANTLKSVELEEHYAPCRLYSYSTDVADQVVVPRDIYREDIKAIQIKSVGSMFDNQVCFYYHSNDVEKNNLNKLCVVGTIVKGFFDDEDEFFYFGLYEETRGRANLINPDPFMDDPEKKYILKDFEPTFVAPVVAMVNPKEIVDQTELKKQLPRNSDVRNEERYIAELNFLKRRLRDAEENEEMAKKIAKQLAENAAKLEEVRNEIRRSSNLELRDKFFKSEKNVIDKIKEFKVVKNKTA